jgi:hypothetical protein
MGNSFQINFCNTRIIHDKHPITCKLHLRR